MLSSQIISVSQTSMSPLLQTSISSSTAMFRSNGTLPRRPRPHHQIRTIRIGLWSSYLEPNFQKEFRRRNRAIKHKYMAAINRKLSWDRQYPSLARQFGFKGFMCSAWRGRDPRPAGRWVNVDRLSTENLDQQRNNIGIEDVELNAVEKLWGKDGFYELLRARSREFRDELNDLNNSVFKLHSSETKPTQASTSNATNPEDSQAGHKTRISAESPEYEIDPITNRKVFRKHQRDNSGSPVDIPVMTFKGYGSQFTKFEPPKSQSRETQSKSKPINNHERQAPEPTSRQHLQDYEGSETYQPYFAYEPDREKPTEAQDDQVTFKWSSWFTSREKPIPKRTVESCPVQEGLRDYDNRTSYEPSPWHEPEDKVPGHIYDSNPVHHGLKEFDSLACYGPLKTSKEGSANIITSTDSTTEAGLNEFDTKASYGPVLHNEPDGKIPEQPDVVADGLRNFDNQAGYGQKETSKDTSLHRAKSRSDKFSRYQNDIDTREDLDLLRASDVRAASGISKSARKESEDVKLAKRKELEEDFQRPQQFSYTDEIFAPEENSEAKPKKLTRKLTGNFVRDFPEEFTTSWTASEDGSGSLSLKDSKSSKLPYQQQIENDVQGAEKAYIEGRASKEGFVRSPNTTRLQTSLDREMEAEKSTYSQKPQGLESSYSDECKLQLEAEQYSEKPGGLESSYIEECASNDANGDAIKTKSAVEDNNAPVPAEAHDVNLTKEESEVIDRLCGRGFIRDQAVQAYFSCNRNEELAAWYLKKQSTNSADKVALGPDHKDKDLVDQIKHIYESKYGKIDLVHRHVSEDSKGEPSFASDNAQATAAPKLESQEPTVYKILAYDPTMQSISVAETTSIVNDTASALTPAEVLLRLSNPTKFFPHFQPLQDEGYEIISGSGDVLVFRKVRAAAPPTAKTESSYPSQDSIRKNMNPIDGMQSRPIVATGNFASPTGFVNYDQPEEPAFKSNIDVRREEPVFSGKSSWAEGEKTSEHKRPGLGKRVLIGGAMVGSCSYAIGVVSEYFKSGGADGRGPQTF